MLVIGAVAGWAYDKWVAKTPYADVGRRLGVLMASGMIVGESLFGVLIAGVIGATNNEAPFAMASEDWPWAMPLAIVGFIAAAIGLYYWTKGKAAKV
jgi:uncharacterized oligopeptide transporter (OPT) family protein